MALDWMIDSQRSGIGSGGREFGEEEEDWLRFGGEREDWVVARCGDPEA
jgi:hypothetical protein